MNENLSQHNTILYNWKIAGEAGYGIVNTAGPIFAKTLMRAGFSVFVYSEYPSLIRGGHNSVQVLVSLDSAHAPYSRVDQLVALNANAVIQHQDEVKDGGEIIYDAAFDINNSRLPALSGIHTKEMASKKIELRDDINFIPVNFEAIAKDVGGSKVMRNMASLGISLYLFESVIRERKDLKILKDDFMSSGFLPIANVVLDDFFGRKGEEIVEINKKVLAAGYNILHFQQKASSM